ncbi:DUF418 domain-containing protein [Macrococcus lamae]|uniref:DUF418 domain-containing protein n=1 Tax=Macrococcus lamae TaxID=198484 RepID=A0A4R6BX90_9STAP|nr:DUF418 domain-containing protein [Macrococcus lamae]TDM12825.1 DUF418 domain-containing protein [Macrococcus lamae]
MDRIKVVDSLRGFSLFGILMANLLIFQFGMYGKEYTEVYHIEGFSLWLIKGIKIFIEGSFMPIFAFLFGFGLIKLAESLKKRGLGVKRHVFRRGIGLLILGLLHALFFFEGDILTFYGPIVLLLVFLVNRSIKTLVITSVISFILLFGVGMQFPDLINEAVNTMSPDKLTEKQHEYLLQQKEVYSTGTATDLLNFMMQDDPFMGSDALLPLIMLIGLLLFFPVFLTGMIAAKSRFFETGMTVFKKRMLICIPIGLLLNAAGVNFEESELALNAMLIGDFVLSLGYIVLFYYLYHRCTSRLLFNAFEAVGKLSLTNYIMQSVFHSWIYYSRGLGRFGDDDFVLSAGLALLFFVLQVVFSSLYMRFFKYGPLEYMLRAWTYLSWKPYSKRRLV